MSGYDYGNARLRAMKSRLLSGHELEALAEIRNLDSLIAALAKTVYRRVIETAIVRASDLACVTEALRLDMMDTLGRVHGFYSGEEHDMVAVILLSYDLHNVKTILRGLAKNAPLNEIRTALVPVGELTENTLAALAKAADPRAAIDLLASMGFRIAHPLLSLRTRRPGVTTPEMELELDRWYFQEARQALPYEDGVMASALNLEADVVNLLTALRFVHKPSERDVLRSWLDTDDLRLLFVGPGSLSFDTLAQMGRQDNPDDALALLAGTPYRAPLEAALDPYRRSRRLSEFESQLRRLRLQRLAGLIVNDPLGIGVPLGYFALKTNELSNIRWIAQGIHLGLDPRAIKQELELAA